MSTEYNAIQAATVAREDLRVMRGEMQLLRAERDQLRAENKRLREGLEFIAKDAELALHEASKT